ncbi:MAG: hypothetical protein AB1679_09440 [Actinomycetota bacterium]
MPSTKSKRFALAGLVVVMAAAGGTLLSIGRDRPATRLAASSQHPTQIPTSTSAPNPPTDELVEFRGEQAGFTLRYPGAWARPTSRDPEVVFVAAEHDPARNLGGSILVRATPLPNEISRAQLAEVRRATDEIVAAAPDVEVKAQPAETEVAGLPGWYYLYTFRDPVSGQRGAHSHYFLFRGRTMLSVVLQALPQDDFGRLAPLFDRIVGSLRVL